jgi:hypothetical protein
MRGLSWPSAIADYDYRFVTGVSRCRPLARRRARIRRPARVLIRWRNPCVRARRIRLGWYVRFIGPFQKREGE